MQLDVSPLSFKFFDRWCDFMFRFGQVSRQVQNFKQDLLPENPDSQLLLDILSLADLFAVK